MTFLIIGDANADIVASVTRFPAEGDDLPIAALVWASGGSAANVAVGLALLGAPARLLARVGVDPAGHVALAAATAAHVDLAHIQHDRATATGTCFAVISPAGERTFFSFRGANIDLAAPSDTAFASVRWLHVGGHALLAGAQRATTLQVIAAAQAHGLPISLDLCLPLVQHDSALIHMLLPQIALLFGNEPEIAALGNFERAQHGIVVVKRGADGCAVTVKGQTQHVDAYPAQVVDTNGCGDAFIAVFLWAMSHGCAPQHCAQLANAAGARAAEHVGAATGLPDQAALAAFVRAAAPNLALPL